ncbi:MAG: methyltransferase [Bacteroidales bacterium]|jgi:tRNA1Val (adenine37-N6)-methyltransferase|nr:methyltransferase [Bacteroidales bacterium]
MGNDIFRFKQFAVGQALAAMKVGEDSVLLGAWADVSRSRRILDVGTGTGLLALMMAQRTCGKAMIDAVEIDADACRQARLNVADSPWAEQIKVFHADFRDFAQQNAPYDLIISNPPYFRGSLQSANRQRMLARHDNCLSLSDLNVCAMPLLAPDGIIAVVLPPDEAQRFIRNASPRLSAVRILHVQAYPAKPPYRTLLELSPKAMPVSEATLCIENETRNGYTDEYRSLTQAFYLKLSIR